MVSFVYRPKARGKGSRLWSGRYRFDDMPKPVTVPLHTPDELVARTRLNNLIIRLQRQKEGLAVTEPMREATGKTFAEVVIDYGADLRAMERRAQHVKDTTRRLLRMARECRWRSIADVTASSFVQWRSRAMCMSAKTRKEYQISLNAFYRWLINSGRYDRNPIVRVAMPETRGKAERKRRAFTPQEIHRLLDVAEHRRLPYLFLLYTGLRYREAWGILWRDVYLNDATGPFILVRAERSKDREKRPVPLHSALAAELRELAAIRSRRHGDGSRVFRGIFPSQKGSLGKDLKMAGIEKKDSSGYAIDFQSFRKTWTTMGVRAGVSLRSAQEILGHSTPDLTANAYTDVAGLELHREMEKIPWHGGQRELHQTPENRLSLDGGPYWARTLGTLLQEGHAGKKLLPKGKEAELARAALAEIIGIYLLLGPAARARMLAAVRKIRGIR